jgi:hypothetical protein
MAAGPFTDPENRSDPDWDRESDQDETALFIAHDRPSKGYKGIPNESPCIYSD